MPAFATPEPITATLTMAGAEVRIAASERSDTVVLVEPVNSANQSDLNMAENTKVDFSAGELSIETTKSYDKIGLVGVTIELPAGSKLVVKTARADVRADGRLGECEVDVASGQVQLDHITTLRGCAAAGELAVGHLAGAANLEGGAAAVRIGEVEGVVRYEGSTGKIWIGHAWSDIDLSGTTGSFDIDRAEGNVIVKAGNCPIRVGHMTRGQAELTNASGGIEVGISEGTDASVDARSTKGKVRNSLPTRDNSDGLENTVKVYARTRLDDIVIHRAAV